MAETWQFEDRRTITSLDPSVLAALASLDGATVTDRSGRLLAAGAILRHPSEHLDSRGVIEGARTNVIVPNAPETAAIRTAASG